jgi:hypothetical protein
MTLARRITHTVRRASLAAAVVLAAAPLSPLTAQMVERFDADPLTGQSRNVFIGEGDVASRFTFLADEPAHFPGDHDGTLRVVYDTTLPTARLSTATGQVFSLDADFDFGAILTIRSGGFFADPNGFSQIAFGLWNAATTGLNRTSFPSDSFDLVEFDYFPNVTSFGGPFVSPSVFGGNVADNAFFNFAFNSAETTLPLDVPLLVQGHYNAALRRLSVGVSRHVRSLIFERIAAATVTVDLSRIDPTFLVNTAGIAGYFEGYRSIHAVVDYDLLFTGPLPAPWSMVVRRVGTRSAAAD